MGAARAATRLRSRSSTNSTRQALSTTSSCAACATPRPPKTPRQEVWVKAYRELHRLDEPQAFPAWLYRRIAGLRGRRQKKNRRCPATTELTDYDTPDATEDPERSALQRERPVNGVARRPARDSISRCSCARWTAAATRKSRRCSTLPRPLSRRSSSVRQGFAKTYARLDSAVQEDRCHHAHKSMAAIIDGEATPVQKKAVHAHVDACTPCSGELTRMQRAAATYAALVPPVPAPLGERIFESLGIAGASAPPVGGAAGGIAKLFALRRRERKIAAVSLVATGAVTAAAMTTRSAT